MRGSTRRSGNLAPPGERLRASGMSVHFAGLRAVDDVDVALDRGEILGLIGPNGAGKTTLVNALSGFQEPTAGRIHLGDREVTGWPAHRLTRAGLARTFQSVRLFRRLSVLENVTAGALALGVSRAEAESRALELLEQARLGDLAEVRGDALSHGDERRVGIVRALATRPTFLLLDEPAAGLNEAESDELVSSLAELRQQFGLGLLVIEHDMRLIMRLCDRIHVIDHGKTIAIGTPAEVRVDPAVLEAYLGSKRAPRDGELHG
jgi:branched-chain amino acid transport system ATP-binding protein